MSGKSQTTLEVVLRAIGAAFICYTFFTSGIILSLLHCTTLILWPFNKRLYRIINCKLAYCHWCQAVFMAENWAGMDCLLYIKDPDERKYFGNEHAVVLMNHRTDIDWLMGWMCCDRCGCLGSSKVIAKHELKYFPFIGWSWSMLEIIFVKRDWKTDKENVLKGLKIISEYPVHCWTLLFSEGTRFTESKHKRSMEIAKEKGLPPLKHHLLPRTKGFTSVVEAYKGKVPALYDCTMIIDKKGAKPNLASVLMGRKCTAHLLVNRIELDSVPTCDEAESAQYCHQLFQQKDEAYEYFMEHGTYEGFQGVYKRYPVPKLWYNVVNQVFWMTLLCIPILYCIHFLLVSGSMWQLLTAATSVCVVAFLLKKFLHITNADKGSSYGHHSKEVDQSNGATNGKKLH